MFKWILVFSSGILINTSPGHWPGIWSDAAIILTFWQNVIFDWGSLPVVASCPTLCSMGKKKKQALVWTLDIKKQSNECFAYKLQNEERSPKNTQ